MAAAEPIRTTNSQRGIAGATAIIAVAAAGECDVRVSFRHYAQGTRLTIVSTTITRSLCLGGAELTYQGELGGAGASACVTEPPEWSSHPGES